MRALGVVAATVSALALAAPAGAAFPGENGRIAASLGSQLAGNAALLQHAMDRHAQMLDGFETNGIDYQVMVGTGETTITGVQLLPGALNGLLGGGDGTVPTTSAVQGPPGTSDPLGENVGIHYVCGVGHVALPARS